jgi:hypothetical protein
MAPIAFLLLAAAPCCIAISVFDYGAIANDTSFEAAVANGKAWYDAVMHANINSTDRSVVFPAPNVFTYLPFAPVTNISDVTIVIDAVINAWPGDMGLWPNTSSGGRLNLMEVDRSTRVTVTGRGTIEGNGYQWWWFVILTGIDNRPNLLMLNDVTSVVVSGITLRNGPMYHLMLNGALHALVEHVKVHVDVTAQMSLLERGGYLRDGLPIFPLNTDGIDISGKNVTVRYCHVENFDDALCVKPSNGNSRLTNCSQDMHFHDCTITNGVGASIGSVPPDRAVNCVRNITFERITFNHPLKVVYIKPNPCPNGPAVDGTGIIDQVTYKDIYADRVLWWAIWVSTQQQAQPGHGANTGCSFFYPILNSSCPTQPCVPVTRLTIKNFTAGNTVLSPGILRCNESNPCRDFLFDGVNIVSDTGFPVGQAFLCHAVENFTMVRGTPVECVYNYTGLSP